MTANSLKKQPEVQDIQQHRINSLDDLMVYLEQAKSDQDKHYGLWVNERNPSQKAVLEANSEADHTLTIRHYDLLGRPMVQPLEEGIHQLAPTAHIKDVSREERTQAIYSNEGFGAYQEIPIGEEAQIKNAILHITKEAEVAEKTQTTEPKEASVSKVGMGKR